MLEPIALQATSPAIDDCWNRIGNHGDHTCPRLADHVLCRNCPVYAAAAKTLLDRLPVGLAIADISADAIDTTVASNAITGRNGAQAGEVIIVFRVGSEWLAVPARALEEVSTSRRIHSLPHRRGGVILGVANVRGNLTVCLSPAVLLGLTGDAAPAIDAQPNAQSRMLILTTAGQSVVLPVDQVDGARRLMPGTLRALPATVSGAALTLARGMVREGDRDIGVLDDARLRDQIVRSLR